MTDAAAPPPPKKQAGPMKFILIGCGILTGLFILGMGSCAGVMYVVYRSTDPVAEVGAAYLKNSPELKESLGEHFTVRRNKLGWNVNVQNDGGNARIAYSVLGDHDRMEREATVWLIRTAGKWSAVGARVKGSPGKEITVGKPPSEHLRIDWDD